MLLILGSFSFIFSYVRKLLLILDEKKRQVLAILNEDKEVNNDIQSLIDNPWQGLLGDDDSCKSVY